MTFSAEHTPPFKSLGFKLLIVVTNPLQQSTRYNDNNKTTLGGMTNQ